MVLYGYVAHFFRANLFQFVFVIGLIKEGSAAFLSLVKALSVPLTTVFFSMEWIMGKHAAKLTLYLLLGGLVICAGLIVFAYGSYRAEKKNKKIEILSDTETATDQTESGSLLRLPINSNHL